MISMKKLSVIAVATLLLAACENSRPAFHRMSEQELVAYNASVDAPDQIYCVEEVRAGSFIRKRFCASLADIANALENQINGLDVINYSPRGIGLATPGYRD